MRARRTDAPRKTAITMAVMAPGPKTPAHTNKTQLLLVNPTGFIHLFTLKEAVHAREGKEPLPSLSSRVSVVSS